MGRLRIRLSSILWWGFVSDRYLWFFFVKYLVKFFWGFWFFVFELNVIIGCFFRVRFSFSFFLVCCKFSNFFFFFRLRLVFFVV